VPWDDRRASDARVEDLREAKVREYLRDVRSGLLDAPDARDVYRRMRITTRVNGHEVPRNAGLLFFSSEPVEWFRGARIEVVQFAADRAGDVQEERVLGKSERRSREKD
jgi:ATP-dependent DNA helicase RecG